MSSKGFLISLVIDTNSSVHKYETDICTQFTECLYLRIEIVSLKNEPVNSWESSLIATFLQ